MTRVVRSVLLASLVRLFPRRSRSTIRKAVSIAESRLHQRKTSSPCGPSVRPLCMPLVLIRTISTAGYHGNGKLKRLQITACVPWTKRLFCITGQICQNLGRAYEKIMHAKPGSSRTATGAKGKRMRIKQMSTRLTKWKNVVAAKARVWSHQLIAGIRRRNLRIPLPQAVYGDGAA